MDEHFLCSFRLRWAVQGEMTTTSTQYDELLASLGLFKVQNQNSRPEFGCSEVQNTKTPFTSGDDEW